MVIESAISIVIPAWNESENIKSLVDEISSVMQAGRINYELIFVDDHSTDNTSQVIESLVPSFPITLIKKSGKRGRATAIMQGLRNTHYPYIAIMDADLQYSPKTIPAMIDALEQGADMVIAAKHKNDYYSGLKVF